MYAMHAALVDDRYVISNRSQHATCRPSPNPPSYGSSFTHLSHLACKTHPSNPPAIETGVCDTPTLTNFPPLFSPPLPHPPLCLSASLPPSPAVAFVGASSCGPNNKRAIGWPTLTFPVPLWLTVGKCDGTACMRYRGTSLAAASCLCSSQLWADGGRG